jgi:hypothetical protein
MRKIIYFSILFFLSTAALFSMGGSEPRFYGDESSPHTLLIVTESSDFKDALVNRIVNSLEDYYISIYPLSSLKDHSASDYSAVIIINTAKIQNIDKDIFNFLDTNSSASNLFIITTQDSLDWEPDLTVEALSTASLEEDIPELLNEIINWLKRIEE